MWLIADGHEPRAMSKESYECWLEFLRDMVARGMNFPVAVTSDGAPGLIKAIEAVFPKSEKYHLRLIRESFGIAEKEETLV